jgi:hypothetical protein
MLETVEPSATVLQNESAPLNPVRAEPPVAGGNWPLCVLEETNTERNAGAGAVASELPESVPPFPPSFPPSAVVGAGATSLPLKDEQATAPDRQRAINPARRREAERMVLPSIANHASVRHAFYW